MSGFPLIRITKIISHVSEILYYDGLWENKKLSDENHHFDPIDSLISIG